MQTEQLHEILIFLTVVQSAFDLIEAALNAVQIIQKSTCYAQQQLKYKSCAHRGLNAAHNLSGRNVTGHAGIFQTHRHDNLI